MLFSISSYLEQVRDTRIRKLIAEGKTVAEIIKLSGVQT